MIATPALLLAAGGVGLGHAVLPDHWVPLAVLGRTRRYPLSRVARLSALAGVAHVLVSVILGAIVVVVGLQFRSQVQNAQDTIVGVLLIGTGVVFAVVELAGRGHGHAHGHDHAHEGAGDGEGAGEGEGGGDAERDGGRGSRLSGLAAVMVPFGAAASPDLTILPVFLAATTAGTATAVGALAVFAAVTIGTIVGLTVLAAAGGYQVRGHWLDRWGNGLSALTLIVIGTLVLVGVL